MSDKKEHEKALHAERMKRYYPKNTRKKLDVSLLVYETIKTNADSLGLSIDKYLREKLQIG